MKHKWNHLIDIESLSVGEIDHIIHGANVFKQDLKSQSKNISQLTNKIIALLFYENSTRTKCSFELAAHHLGIKVINLHVSTSSVQKGETIKDTISNLIAMGIHAIVLRHPSSGVCHLLAESFDQQCSFINAGDGFHEHPTQALLDYFTMTERLGRIKGKKIVIVGDIGHSRVARSNIFLLTQYGADVHCVAPSTMLPQDIEKLGVTSHTNLDEALQNADVVMALRIQFERHNQTLTPSKNDYIKFYRIDHEKIKQAKSNVLLMHPGPVNRDIEITTALADDPNYSVILEQTANGIPVRMAVLSMILEQE